MRAKRLWLRGALTAALGAALILPAHAEGRGGDEGHHRGLNRVNHIILLMQENHSFDNYLGVLALAPGSPYHGGKCERGDHRCVDGLSCARDSKSGAYQCANSNRDDDGSTVFAFHATDFCVNTDVNHGWVGTHQEGNFNNPNDGLIASPNDGFVLVNDASN